MSHGRGVASICARTPERQAEIYSRVHPSRVEVLLFAGNQHFTII